METEEMRTLIASKAESFVFRDGTLVRHSLRYLTEKTNAAWWEKYLLNLSITIDDFIFVALALVFLMGLRLFLSGCCVSGMQSYPSLFKSLARRYKFVRRGKVAKFSENAWYALWHCIAFTWGCWILSEEAGSVEDPGWIRLHIEQPDGRWYWFISEREYRRGSGGWPLLLPTQAIRTFYLTQLGFWLSCLAFINLETRRKDYWVLLGHHVVTITLVGFSYLCSYWKLGLVSESTGTKREKRRKKVAMSSTCDVDGSSRGREWLVDQVVLLLHDQVDVFLYLSKSLHYSVASKRLVEMCFGVFAVSYFVSRLVLFPLYCVYPTLNFELVREMTKGFIDGHRDIPGAVVLPAFLVILVAMHAYWFTCIVRMISRIAKAALEGNEFEDVRSEDEDSESEEGSRKSSKASKRD